MSELRQRDPRQHDERHLVYVRLQPCCVCGTRRAIEAAHIRMSCPEIGKDPTGMQEKPHDKWTVPLCNNDHQSGQQAQHRSNERKWWNAHRIDPLAIAAALWIASGGAARAAMEKPAHRLRPVKARKPREKRAKMPGSKRTIAGRTFSGKPIPSVIREVRQ